MIISVSITITMIISVSISITMIISVTISITLNMITINVIVSAPTVKKVLNTIHYSFLHNSSPFFGLTAWYLGFIVTGGAVLLFATVIAWVFLSWLFSSSPIFRTR